MAKKPQASKKVSGEVEKKPMDQKPKEVLIQMEIKSAAPKAEDYSHRKFDKFKSNKGEI